MEQEEVRVLTNIIATKVIVCCPYCGETIDGWCGDPRGVEDTCEECGMTYKVHPDADIDFY